MNRLLLGLVLLALAAPAAAQMIPIKTVPVAEGTQFLLFPSQNLGMGGVSIALDDPLHDAFENPAKGIDLDGLRFATTPVYYGFASDVDALGEGSGRTLPLGMMVREQGFFGGAALAWQELIVPRNPVFFPLRADVLTADVIDPAPSAISQNNVYLFGTAGLRIPGTKLSAGVSALHAGLNGLEGVRMLYWNGNEIGQHGQMGVYRAGLYYRAGDRTAEVLVAHHRFDMTHTMQRWDPLAQDVAAHREYDETRGWAVQLGYRQPLAGGWQAGAQLTGDWKRHPKIPNYDLMLIPRDPGRSSAYNVGIGLARHVGRATFGLDVVYEPIWSHTWADALTPVETVRGAILPAGAMTVENHFRFDNMHLRMGLRRAGDRFDVLGGVRAHAIRYRLHQEDFVEERTRDQREHWIEWTASAGVGVRFPEFQIRYLGLLTLGTGQPGVDRGVTFAEALSANRADFLIAPTGPLTLNETRVVTHQITVIVPITQ